ncbi:MAG TPA: hypothetical protein VMU89_06600, partial [Thermomicrobiaceae bacterium]|nr:hypothetical protein [Thermomicrobiaceae bacterium]
ERWCRAHNPGLPHRGGPPKGNRNAVTHGLYARWFTADERQQLEDVAGIPALTGEIAVLRVALARLLAANADDALTVADRLAAVAHAVDSIGRALRTERYLSGEAAAGLAAALLALMTELGLGDGAAEHAGHAGHAGRGGAARQRSPLSPPGGHPAPPAPSSPRPPPRARDDRTGGAALSRTCNDRPVRVDASVTCGRR